MTIKSFRGRMKDNGAFNQEVINLHTNDGSIGYRIVKFELMPVNPFAQSYEALMQIFKIPKTASPTTFDFDDNTLVAAGMYSSNADAKNYPDDVNVIFDNEIFNQDLYINYRDFQSNDGTNYYIELEAIKLSLDENTVATLKDIRNIEQPIV